jgi:outer membrane protein OmpA-like peptidoglycan-associated protein
MGWVCHVGVADTFVLSKSKRIPAMIARKLTAFAVLSAMGVAGCTTIDPATGQKIPNKAATGAILGVLGGAAAGTAAGGDDRRNAVIGAGIGGLTGAAVGNYMDRQERALRAKMAGTGVSVERVSESQINLVMPSDITFDVDRAEVKPEFRGVIANLAEALASQPSTTIDIIGHADANGGDAYNQSLSERRAQSVAFWLRNQGVQPPRLVAFGRGELEPIATNATETGRARNRRVELKVRAVTAS